MYTWLYIVNILPEEKSIIERRKARKKKEREKGETNVSLFPNFESTDIAFK